MSTQNYSTVASRNLIKAELNMLDHAEPIQVIGSFGSQKTHPKRKTDTVVFRRLKPFNATGAEVADITTGNFVASEGTTPTANTIDYTDVTVTLEQYNVLFKYSSKTAYMYEDDIPADMQKLTGETMGEVAELVAYGMFKAGTSVTYANGSARSTLAAKVSINKLRSVTRSLESNRAKHVTSIIKAGPNFGTSAVEPGWVVFMHTDCIADVRDLPGFTPRVEYGSTIKPLHAREIGACEEFRFVTSPLFKPYLAAGASVGGGFASAGASSNDVYPMIVIGEEALGHVSLKGEGYTAITPTHVPCNVKNHANPSGMFGYVGADFWYAPVRLNENWMDRLEVCVTDL